MTFNMKASTVIISRTYILSHTQHCNAYGEMHNGTQATASFEKKSRNP